MFFSLDCFANDVFYDNFDIKNEENWDFQENGGKIIVNGKLGMYSASTSFPYVVARPVVVFPEVGDFTVENFLKFPESLASGVGLGIGLLCGYV